MSQSQQDVDADRVIETMLPAVSQLADAVLAYYQLGEDERKRVRHRLYQRTGRYGKELVKCGWMESVLAIDGELKKPRSGVVGRDE